MDPVRKDLPIATQPRQEALSNGVDGKKILYVITKSNWGGAQAYAYMLASHLSEQGASVKVALGGTGAADAQAGLLAQMLRAAGVETIFISSFMRDVSLLREARALVELYRVIRSERPDMLHVNSSKAGGLGALAGRLARVPRIVFTSHGLAYDEDRPAVARALIWLATWVTFLLCHRVIVISHDTYARAQRLPFCARKIRLVYNGIAPQNLLERAAARATLLPTAPEDGVWIGTIAELTKNKNLSSLIQAAALVRDRGHAFTLCIISPGEEYDALSALITELDLERSVHLLGFVANASNYLRAFDIFALVSIKEGLPYVLLEAAEANCAVVATRIPGTTDIIDKNTGILVTPKQIGDIARALERLITSPDERERLGTALHTKVRDRFSIERMLKGVLATYTD